MKALWLEGGWGTGGQGFQKETEWAEPGELVGGRLGGEAGCDSVESGRTGGSGRDGQKPDHSSFVGFVWLCLYPEIKEKEPREGNKD